MEAWDGFRSQSLTSFRAIQRGWAVAGFLCLGLLVGANVLAWNNYTQGKAQADLALFGDLSESEKALLAGVWAWQDDSGSEQIMYRFSKSESSVQRACSIIHNSDPALSAEYKLVGDRVLIYTSQSLKEPNEFQLSPDRKMLTRIGGSGRIFQHKESAK